MSPLLFSTLPLATCIPCPLRVGSHPGLLSVPFYFPFPLHARFHIRPGTRLPMSKKEEFERSEREACLPVVQLPRNRQNLVGKKKRRNAEKLSAECFPSLLHPSLSLKKKRLPCAAGPGLFWSGSPNNHKTKHSFRSPKALIQYAQEIL